MDLKKAASTYASNDWILSLDADECLDKDTKDFIDSIDLNNTKYDSFSFRRKLCGDEWIKAAGFYPDEVTRLYDKTKVNFDDRADHAAVQSKICFKTKCHIIHNTYQSMTEWVG